MFAAAAVYNAVADEMDRLSVSDSRAIDRAKSAAPTPRHDSGILVLAATARRRRT